MRRRTHSALPMLAATALITSLASADVPRGTEAWRTFETPSFTVITDDKDRAKNLVAELEKLRSTLAEILAEPVEDGRRTIVYYFGTSRSFRRYAPQIGEEKVLPAGYFIPWTDTVTLIAVNGGHEAHRRRILFHEYIHDYTASSMPQRPPVWFREGIAEFYSTFHLSGTTAHVGKLIDSHIHWLRRNEMIPLEELFRVTMSSPVFDESRRIGVFYAESWALVHYLMSTPKTRAQLQRFVQLLADYDVDEAFSKAFEVTPAEMFEALAQYVKADRFNYTLYRSERFAFEEKVAWASRLRYPDALFHLGRLAIFGLDDDGDAAREHFEAALAADSTHAPTMSELGYLAEATGDFDGARRWYQRAIQHDPDDFAPHFRLARLIHAATDSSGAFAQPPEPSKDDARASYERALALNPGFFAAHLGLARTYLGEPSPGRGIRAAAAARRLKPDDTRAALVLLALLAGATTGPGEVSADDYLEASRAMNALPSIGDAPLEATRLALMGWGLTVVDSLAAAGSAEEALAILDDLEGRCRSADEHRRVSEARRRIDTHAAMEQDAADYAEAVAHTEAGRLNAALDILDRLVAETQDVSLLRASQDLKYEVEERLIAR